MKNQNLRSTRGYGHALVCLLVLCPGLFASANEDSFYQAASVGDVSRASVVDLPPAADQRGVVPLRSSTSAEDVIQPVLEIERGKTVLLKPSYPVRRIAVGDPSIVDFVVNNQNEVQLVAKGVGSTNVLIWDTDSRLQASIDIHVGAVRAQLVREMQRVIGRNDVTVDMAGESVVLRGTVASLQDSEAAERVARAFFTEREDSQEEAQAPKVINLLSVGGNQQVMIEIVIAELNRGLNRALGTNLDVLWRDGATTRGLTSMVRNLTQMSLDANGNPFTSLSNDIKLVGNLIDTGDMSLGLFLEAVEANRLGKVLAEPTLTARSGELASFLVGGEIPIPVAQNNSVNGSPVITVIFKSFGVQLDFTPTVLSPDRIHLRVAPEVSQPDATFGTQVLGTAVPSFRTRRAATAVELGDGQTFAIAGLLQEFATTDVEKLPFLGEVPILGQLFRSERYRRDETELVMLVTPRLVKPIGPQDVRLPSDDFIDPDVWELYGLGRSNGSAKNRDTIRLDTPNLRSDSKDERGLMGVFGRRLRVPTLTSQEN